MAFGRGKAFPKGKKGRGRKVFFRPMRIVSYGVLLLLDILLYSVLQSYFLWIVAVVMAICPFFSIWGLFCLGKSLGLRVAAGQDMAVCGGSICLEVRISNPVWLSVLDSRILLKISNIFYGTESEAAVSMPVRLHHETVLLVPVLMQDLGRFRIECMEFMVQDILGMVRYSVDSAAFCEFFVCPQEKQGEDREVTGFLAGAAESEESHSRGSDFAEVSDIREYIPGDRIRDIHWKLSAKQGDLMVKERIAMAGSEMVILLQFPPSKQQVHEVLQAAYELGKAFAIQQLPVRLLCWNQRMFAFEEYCCGGDRELLGIFGEILGIPLAHRLGGEMQGQYMRNCYPYLGNYLVVAHRDGEVQVEMCENS